MKHVYLVYRTHVDYAWRHSPQHTWPVRGKAVYACSSLKAADAVLADLVRKGDYDSENQGYCIVVMPLYSTKNVVEAAK